MKSIIITGAGSGLGKELAFIFARQGYHIILTGRNMDKLKIVEQQIKTADGHADSYIVDITEQEEIRLFIQKIASRFELYGLINNAGVGHFGPFDKLSSAEIKEMLATNVLGTIYMTQTFLSYVKEKEDGLLMNIISTAGLKGKVNEAGYVASKFAVRGLTESLQKEYEHTGIEIKAVYMGGMDTPFWEKNSHIADKSRLQSPAKIAKLIYSQLSEDAIIIEAKK